MKALNGVSWANFAGSYASYNIVSFASTSLMNCLTVLFISTLFNDSTCTSFLSKYGNLSARSYTGYDISFIKNAQAIIASPGLCNPLFKAETIFSDRYTRLPIGPPSFTPGRPSNPGGTAY